MGDKPKEKLPTKMYGSTPVFGAGDNPSVEDSEKDYSTVRGGTLPPPAPPTTLSAPIMPKRPEAAPRASRMAMAERVAQTLEEEGDSQMAEAVRTSVAPSPLSEDEKEEVARLSGYILHMEDDGPSLENTLEGPDSGEEIQSAEGGPIVVESIHGSEDSEDEPTQVVETGEETEVITATAGDDAVNSDDGSDADGEDCVVEQLEEEVDLPKPVEPVVKVEDSWGMDEQGSTSPDDIPTIPPPDASAVRACISEMRKVRNSQLFSIPEEEAKAPFLYRIDKYGSFRCRIADGEKIVIGRSPECDIVVDESEFVSAFHAEVRREGDMCFVSDLNSLNSTWITEILVAPGFDRELFDGDKIMLGGKEGVTLFFIDQMNKGKNRPRMLYASSGRGGDMTENEMRAPTVVVDPDLLDEASASESPPAAEPKPETPEEEATDPDATALMPAVVPEPELKPEEQVPDLPVPAEPEPAEPKPEEEVTDPDATAPMPAVVVPEPVAPVNSHVAPTVPLPVDLPEKKVVNKPGADKETVSIHQVPPNNPPPPLPSKSNKMAKVLAVMLLAFFIGGTLFVVANESRKWFSDGIGDNPSTPAMVAENLNKEVTPTTTEEEAVVSVPFVMAPLIDGPLGWEPVDPTGPLASIVKGTAIPRSIDDCFPSGGQPLQEVDVLRCCLILGNNGDGEVVAKCVGRSTVSVLSTMGALP